MNEELTLSQDGEGLVKRYESCLKQVRPGYFKPYICPAGVLTIGWGHTNHHGRRFDANAVWSQDQCDSAFDEDMRGFEAVVFRLVKVPLNQHQFDALVSFSYNCGEGALAGSSLLRKLNAGDYQGASREFAKWTHGGGRELPGLVKRRASEALLFKSVPDEHYAEHTADATPAHDGPMPQGIDEPEAPKTIFQSNNVRASGALGIADLGEAADTVNTHLEKLQSIQDTAKHMGIMDALGASMSDPKFLLMLAGLAVIGFLIFDRHQKLKWEHV